MAQNLLKIAVICVIVGMTTYALPHEYHSNEEQKEVKADEQIPNVKQSFDQHHNAFQHSFETANGIHVHEYGFFKEIANKKHESLVQLGTVTYYDEKGNPITLTYIADENGFQPFGDHLPTPPPIPDDIAEVLKQLS